MKKNKKNSKPTNQFDAVCAALELAITASTDKKSLECVRLANALAQGMNEYEIERAKKTVMKRLNNKEN